MIRTGSASIVVAALVAAASPGYTQPSATHSGMPAAAKTDVSDRTLVKSLPGFRNGYATVNGVRLHYVVGGKGEPLVLLPGWPETWWTFHKIMPALAEHYTVIVVDLRGMGASSKP
ncbi:MAG TPA: alpha/beta fold hydrolase, partial [Paraburkholderia sp.]|nr:alpha/beta fold hydrolase [Paraburkholderia sp.]